MRKNYFFLRRNHFCNLHKLMNVFFTSCKDSLYAFAKAYFLCISHSLYPRESISLSMELSQLDIQLKTLPTSPGIYQYYDKEEKLLYVGKAKNLKKRVLSYFNKTIDNGRIRTMVKKIHEVRHIVVATETDALLLENNLIKKYQPR